MTTTNGAFESKAAIDEPTHFATAPLTTNNDGHQEQELLPIATATLITDSVAAEEPTTSIGIESPRPVHDEATTTTNAVVYSRKRILGSITLLLLLVGAGIFVASPLVAGICVVASIIILFVFLCNCCLGPDDPKLQPNERTFGVIAVVSLILLPVMVLFGILSLAFSQGTSPVGPIFLLCSGAILGSVSVVMVALFTFGENCCTHVR